MAYRAGIVGLGRIASLFDDDPLRKTVSTHAGAYTKSEDVDLVAAADKDSARLDTFKKRWGVNTLYQDYQEMLQKEKLDILSICTWNDSHCQIVEDAVKSGVKVLFTEKPIAKTLLEADRMVELCEKNKVLLAINHHKRWDEFHQQIRNFIQEGKLGDIQKVTCYYGAGLANTGTHLFDLLGFLFGKAMRVWGIYNGGKKEDPNVDGYIAFESGASAALQSLDWGQYHHFEIDIYGTKGRGRISNSGYGFDYWNVGDHTYFSGYKELKKQTTPFESGEKNSMVNAVSDLVKALRTNGQPMSTGRDGLASLELITAFHLSAQAGGRVIELPVKERDFPVISK